jgi:DNA polymerase-3 subunit epsilon
MREIVIDTEAIGLDPLEGHRIVEIEAVELINRPPTGTTFHRYLCPERAMPADASLIGRSCIRSAVMQFGATT